MNVRRAAMTIAALWLASFAFPVATIACSPAFNPTIAALGPRQVVVVGTVGERIAGGRLFHVERWYNGGAPIMPIVIAFQEGEPVGDCSYPVATGERKIIAPEMEAGGRLSANLATLQGNPDSDGRRWVEEAEALFGPGVVPVAVDAPEPVDAAVQPETSPAGGVLRAILIVAGLVGVVGALFGVAARRRRV